MEFEKSKCRKIGNDKTHFIIWFRLKFKPAFIQNTEPDFPDFLEVEFKKDDYVSRSIRKVFREITAVSGH